MSKTYKTRPLIVRVADPKDKGVGVKEVHDHRDGVCELPTSPEDQVRKDLDIVSLKCYYTFSYNGHGLCGCKMCTDRFGKEAKRTALRREGRKQERNWEDA